eukprot:s472_g7.t1
MPARGDENRSRANDCELSIFLNSSQSECQLAAQFRTRISLSCNFSFDHRSHERSVFTILQSAQKARPCWHDLQNTQIRMQSAW